MNSNRRANMTLYSNPNCPLSHRTRIAIKHKNIDANFEEIHDGQWPEDIAAANPYNSFPTLVERDLVLFDTNIIIEYLEERFPQPHLLPIDPIEKAKMRLMLLRIDKDWFSLWPLLAKQKSGKAHKSLQEDLTVLAPLFDENTYFMNDEFSILDCAIAPLLWRLQILNIKLPAKANAVDAYAKRIFATESFQASLTKTEKGMRI
jgi:RNA polymerase-associated protein